MKILVSLIVLYGLLALIFWGHLELLGLSTIGFMWAQIAILIFSGIFILLLLIIGHYSNKRLELIEFYQGKIIERETELKNIAKQEEEEKQNQSYHELIRESRAELFA